MNDAKDDEKAGKGQFRNSDAYAARIVFEQGRPIVADFSSY